MPRAAAWSAVVRPAIPLPRTSTSYTVRSLRRRSGAGRHPASARPRGRRDDLVDPIDDETDVVDEPGRARARAASATSTSPSSVSIGRSSSASRTSTYSSVDRAARSRRCRGRSPTTLRRIALAAVDRVRRGRSALGTSTGAARAFVGREIGVAARQREPVGFAHERSIRPPRPAGSGRRSCGARRRAAARPCGRSRHGTVRRSRRAW